MDKWKKCLVIGIISVLLLSGCGSNQTEETPSPEETAAETVTTAESIDEAETATEEVIERTWQSDAIEGDVWQLSQDFIKGNSSGNIRSLTAWVEALRPYYDDNLFAKEVVDRYEQDNISSMADMDNDFISGYIQTLLYADLVDYSDMRIYYAYAAGYVEDGSASGEKEYNYRGLFFNVKDSVTKSGYDYENMFVNVFSLEDSSMDPNGVERHGISNEKAEDMQSEYGIAMYSEEGELTGKGNERVAGLHYFTIDKTRFNDILNNSSLVELAREYRTDVVIPMQSSGKISISTKGDKSKLQEGLSQEDLVRLDAENDAVLTIISKYKLEDSDGDEVNVVTFDEFLDDFKKIEKDNLFAQNLVKAAENVNYTEFTAEEKVAFDTYLGLLFQDDVVRYNRSVGNIAEALKGDGSASDKKGNEYQTVYYLFKFSDYNQDSLVSLNYTFLLYYDMGWGTYTAQKEPQQLLDSQYGNYRNCLFEQDGKMALVTIFHGSTYVNPIDVDSLNSVIESNQDFIDFMVDYRDNIYAPIRIAQLEAADARKEEQKAEEEYWENKIPEIGMTPEEVKKTSWGSPDRINKDTYSWGTTEQWVYEKKGYVYFRNGVVSSVSER